MSLVLVLAFLAFRQFLTAVIIAAICTFVIKICWFQIKANHQGVLLWLKDRIVKADFDAGPLLAPTFFFGMIQIKITRHEHHITIEVEAKKGVGVRFKLKVFTRVSSAWRFYSVFGETDPKASKVVEFIKAAIEAGFVDFVANRLITELVPVEKDKDANEGEQGLTLLTPETIIDQAMAITHLKEVPPDGGGRVSLHEQAEKWFDMPAVGLQFMIKMTDREEASQVMRDATEKRRVVSQERAAATIAGDSFKKEIEAAIPGYSSMSPQDKITAMNSYAAAKTAGKGSSADVLIQKLASK